METTTAAPSRRGTYSARWDYFRQRVPTATWISEPVWERPEIQLQDRLTIVADNAAQTIRIFKVWLNDKLLDRYSIQHAEIAGGGTLRFEMGTEPATGR